MSIWHVNMSFTNLIIPKFSFWDTKLDFLAESKRSTNKPQHSETFESVSNFHLPSDVALSVCFEVSAITLSKYCRYSPNLSISPDILHSRWAIQWVPEDLAGLTWLSSNFYISFKTLCDLCNSPKFFENLCYKQNKLVKLFLTGVKTSWRLSFKANSNRWDKH